MVFRFLILSDEVDDFKREIQIDSEATFLELHNAILDSVGYTKDQMASFFVCDDDWSKRTEITLVEMDTSSDVDSYIMEDTHLDELLEDEHQKLLYVFDYMTDRAFFMELREIIRPRQGGLHEIEGRSPGSADVYRRVRQQARVVFNLFRPRCRLLRRFGIRPRRTG